MALGSVFASFAIVIHAQPSTPPAANADEQSCRKFVQDFYDWDWNRYFAHVNEPNAGGFKVPTISEVIRHRPQLLSAQLQRLLLTDAELKARTTDAIVGLEIDPFLNAGNGDGANVPFIVQSVDVNGARCEAAFKWLWPEWGVRPELLKTHSGWIFTNIHYSFYKEDGKTKDLPDDDLIHLLKASNPAS